MRRIFRGIQEGRENRTIPPGGARGGGCARTVRLGAFPVRRAHVRAPGVAEHAERVHGVRHVERVGSGVPRGARARLAPRHRSSFRFRAFSRRAPRATWERTVGAPIAVGSEARKAAIASLSTPRRAAHPPPPCPPPSPSPRPRASERARLAPRPRAAPSPAPPARPSCPPPRPPPPPPPRRVRRSSSAARASPAAGSAHRDSHPSRGPRRAGRAVRAVLRGRRERVHPHGALQR